MAQVWQDLKPGSVLGVSPWFHLKQEMFNEFEALTLSNDKLHTDAEWVAKNTHFKSIIAPGFFVAALLPYFHTQVAADLTGYYPLNYGFDKIRWVEPVPVNSRIRAEFVVMDITPRTDGGSLFKTKVTVEIEGVSRPGMVAEWLGVVMPENGS
jgi:acyl dehydratase